MLVYPCMYENICKKHADWNYQKIPTKPKKQKPFCNLK
jgi:hypothetical protein